MSRLNNITVMGSGVLGGQIAWHSAFKGKTVVVLDISDDALVRCQSAHDHYASIYLDGVGATQDQITETRTRLSYTTDIATAVANADLVIESVPEIPEIKTAAYQKMAPLLPEHTLVATNSSTLLARDFAEASGRPEKFCALHFANLIWALNIVEVMAHPTTAEDTLTQVTEFGIEIGMRPIPIQKEQSGYVLNTWLVALLNAAQTLVTNGISTPEDVDRSYMIGNRGCGAGPMGMIDMVGMETVYNITQHWGSMNNDQQMLNNARYIKEHFIDRGLLGFQTGQGYYQYPNPSFQQQDFLAVPGMSAVPEIVSRAMLKS